MLGREEMRPAANKYQDKYQNELINVSSTTHFSTLFLQKKYQVESSKFRSNHNVSPYNHPFSFTGKEKDAETDFSYFGARYYDSDLSGLFISVDPMADKYPGISPYAYCAWNPVKLIDPDGKRVSTHIDSEGNVLEVYDDDNLGIYMHSDSEIALFNKGKEFEINYDLLIGSTLHVNSFQKGDKIDLNSFAAKEWLDKFDSWVTNACFGAKDGIMKYGLLAKNGGLFDPKSYLKYGSQISKGTYISPRDLGNYAAGLIGKRLGFSKTETLAMYGAFQMAGNDINKLVGSFSSLYEKALHHPQSPNGQRTYGEGEISNFFQRLGYEGINSISKYITIVRK